MGSAPVNLRAYATLLRRNRNFRLLWFAQVVSEVGDWLYAVAIYSLILELTGSAQAVAFAFVLQVLPQFFISPTAGVINDRLSRRKVMIAADWSRAIITFLMLFADTEAALPFLYTLLFLETIFWALFEPGRNAVIPSLTSSEDEMLTANALSATTWSFNLAIGSAIGGLLAAFFGRETVFVVNALSFMVSALLIRAMVCHEPHLEQVPEFRLRHLFDFTPIAEGMRYVRADSRLLVTMFVKAGMGILAANWVIIPVFGERIYPVHIGGLDARSAGMLGMSLLMGCRGLGALVGPLIAGRWSGGDPRRFRIGIIAAYAAAALGYIGLGFTNSLPAACMAVAFAHGGGSVAWVFSTTMLQRQTEDRFRGRVFSAEFAFAMLVMSITTWSAGLLADSGVSVYTLAQLIGILALVPGLLWLRAQRLWRNTP